MAVDPLRAKLSATTRVGKSVTLMATVTAMASSPPGRDDQSKIEKRQVSNEHCQENRSIEHYSSYFEES